jgi:penicillin amidase
LFTETYGERNYRAALLEQIKNPNSPWCDDPKSAQIESCLQSSNKAFDTALEYLSKEYGNDPSSWSWGKAHIAISEHRPFSKVPLIGRLFNLEVPFPGDSNTINVGRLELLRSEQPYVTLQTPSLRAIYDLADLERSLFIYQAGQSGWIQSKFSRNMNPLWANNEYLPLQMTPKNPKRTLELNNK